MDDKALHIDNLIDDDFIDAIESINPEIKRKLDDYNNLEKKYNTMKEELEDIKYKIFS